MREAWKDAREKGGGCQSNWDQFGNVAVVQGALRRSEPDTDPWGQFGDALTSPMMADEEWACGEG